MVIEASIEEGGLSLMRWLMRRRRRRLRQDRGGALALLSVCEGKGACGSVGEGVGRSFGWCGIVACARPARGRTTPAHHQGREAPPPLAIIDLEGYSRSGPLINGLKGSICVHAAPLDRLGGRFSQWKRNGSLIGRAGVF